MTSSAPEEDGRRSAQMLERLTFFSDAVFAIAMTLLVIEVRVPHVERVSDAALGQALLGLMPNYIGYVVSFLVLGRFWVGHHRVMGLIGASDTRLVWANLLLLMVVAFMPFVTAVFADYTEVRVATALYTGWLIVLGLANRWLIHVAFADHLLRPDAPAEEVRSSRGNSWIPIANGAVALVVGMIAPLLAAVALIVGGALLPMLLRRRVSAVAAG